MMSPKQAKFFNLFAMGAGFSFADRALESGMFMLGGGERIIRGAVAFGGLDVIVTNETPRTARLTVSSTVTANDTVTVNGVVFTFVASPAAAGDVDVEASAEAQIDSLVLAINGTGTPGSTTYIEVSAANGISVTTAHKIKHGMGRFGKL